MEAGPSRTPIMAPDIMAIKDSRKLCVRHKQMANQNVNEKLQRSLDSLPMNERAAITNLWSTFSGAHHAKRKIILEGILTMCCFSQLSHLSDSLNQIIRIDPFSLLPREVSLRILGFLDAMSLGRAAQVSRSWKALADDDLLWRRMCGQHIDRKCEKCGWGLPLLERRRLKGELSWRSPAAAVGVGGHDDHAHGHAHGDAHTVITRSEALGSKGERGMYTCGSPIPVGTTSHKRAADDETQHAKRARIESDSESEAAEVVPAAPQPSAASLTRDVRLTRPWKAVYTERLVVERNWRKGRFTSKTLKGHTDGVMCLQYHTALTSPSYPVLITGSYDHTARVWNLNTGEEVRVLRGHTRAVRAVQFDQMLLFTGSMDGTVRMWNWRAGECLRVLEGHTDGVVTLNYNGYLLATGSADSTINVWNFRTGGRFTLRGHDEWVNSVVLWDGKTSPGDLDPTAMPAFKQVSRRSTDASRPGPSFGATHDKTQPDIDVGTMLFSASDDGTVKLWDLETQECLRTFLGHRGQIQSLRVLMADPDKDDAAAVAAADAGSTVVQAHGFHRASQSPPRAMPSPPPDGFDPHAHASAPRDDAVVCRAYLHDGRENARAVSVEREDAKRACLVTGSLDGTVRLWDVETGREKQTLFGHIEGVWGVDMDALRIASASQDRTIKVWDKESRACVQTLVGHRGAVTSLQLSDDLIVSGSDDGDVVVWSFGP
ncbi:hypothetical protein Q5752_003118 [Cryptotrichosporon argae]